MKNKIISQNKKYALMVVDSMNIGDAIQAIAARQFLPRVDYLIERDDLAMLNDVKLGSDDELKMIMNGWYIDDGALFPPPAIAQFKPLLISMHVNDIYANNYTAKAFLTDQARAFFKQFGPVGARDTHTAKFLNDNGVESYFSGCLTLTLTEETSLPKRDHILAVNISDAVYESLRSRTNRPIIRMDVDATQNLNNEEMLTLGEYYLMLYQTAHLVVTTRLHAILPTLAMNGNVLFIEESNAVNKDFKTRFAGLHTLVTSLKAQDFIEDKKGELYDVNRPFKLENGGNELREALIKRCEDYIGQPMRRGFLYGKTLEELVTSQHFVSAMTKLANESSLFYRAEHGWNVNRIGVKPLIKSLIKKVINKRDW